MHGLQVRLTCHGLPVLPQCLQAPLSLPPGHHDVQLCGDEGLHSARDAAVIPTLGPLVGTRLLHSQRVLGGGRNYYRWWLWSFSIVWNYYRWWLWSFSIVWNYYRWWLWSFSIVWNYYR